MRLSKRMAIAALALGVAALFACERKEEGGYRTTGQRSGSDTSWLVKAALSNLSEIEAGRLAETKGVSEDVKTFGRHMVDDHTKANADLTDLAQKKGIAVPKQLDEKVRKTMGDLAGLSGAEFDRKFAEMMVTDHEKAVSLFESNSNARDTDVKAFIDKTLPTLKHHLDMARDLKTKLSGAPKAD